MDNIGRNQVRAKLSNQASIKRIVYLFGPITRLEVAKRLKLTLPTITTNINDMIADGIIRELDEKVSKAGVAGRKSNQIEIDQDSRRFIGVEILKKLRIAVVTDFKGNILKQEVDNNLIENYDGAIKSTAKLISRLGTEGISGIGLCIPGIVDSYNGVLHHMRQWQWKNRTVAEDISRLIHFDGPISLENDAAARAIAYSLFNGTVSGTELYAYLYVSDGISCPLMLNGPDYVAKKLGPGELGYTIINSNLNEEDFGFTGMTSNLAGLRALVAKCTQAALEGQCPELEEVAKQGSMTITDILEAQRRGSPAIERMVTDSLRYLGIAISNTDNIFRPKHFIVESSYFELERNKNIFMDEVNMHLFRSDSDELEFRFIPHKKTTGAVGAAGVAIQDYLGEGT